MNKPTLAMIPLTLAAAPSCQSVGEPPAAIDSAPIPSMRCHRASQPITIDGHLDEIDWTRSDVVELRLNPSGATPTHRTTARALWDDQHLYFAFESEASAMNARMTQRDDPLFDDADVVEVFLNPTDGAESFFEFEVNPLNALLDLYFTNRAVPWPTAAHWNAAGVRTAIHIERSADRSVKGWTMEMVIPLKNFSAATPVSGDIWRVNFCRCEKLSDTHGDRLELCSWSSTLDRQFNWPERFGKLHFVN